MHNQIDIHFKNSTSTIIFDENFSFQEYFYADNVIIITDDIVMKYYGHLINGFKVINVPIGDSCKTTKTVEFLINKLLEYHVDRSFELVGFGGGAVCDLTAYLASIYMRGVEHSFVPSTLLAMVDASIGGKTAINYNNIKNLVGTFKHPKRIFINLPFLKTLPDVEYYSGFAELAKIALVSDAKLFDLLDNDELIGSKSIELSMIYNAIFKKSEIVIKDELDLGYRNILNFGHTLGHIIETEYSLPHGIAVLYGMKFALKMSYHYKSINYDDYLRVISFLDKIPHTKIDIDVNHIISRILSDKKKSGNKIRLILLAGIGNAEIKDFNLEDLEVECSQILSQDYV